MYLVGCSNCIVVIFLKYLTILEFHTKALMSGMVYLRVVLKCSNIKKKIKGLGLDQKEQQNVENQMTNVWGLIILFYVYDFLKISIIELKKILFPNLLCEISTTGLCSSLFTGSISGGRVTEASQQFSKMRQVLIPSHTSRRTNLPGPAPWWPWDTAGQQPGPGS